MEGIWNLSSHVYGSTLKIKNCGENVTLYHIISTWKWSSSRNDCTGDLAKELFSAKMYPKMYPTSFIVKLTACDNKEIYARQRGSPL